MAEEGGEKTEAPTPKRREEAREQGSVARSPDLNAAVVLLGALLLLHWYGGGLFQALQTVVQHMLSRDSFAQMDPHHLLDTTVPQLMTIARAMAPLMLGIIVLAVLANIAQVGWHLTPSRLAPNFAALNPMTGLERLLKRRGIVALAMGILKMTLVGLMAYSAIHSRIDLIVHVEQLTFLQAFGLAGQMIFDIGMRVGVLLLVLAVFDYLWQRRQLEQSLKMSKQEVKEEMRRMEGDPKVKQRRRQIANQLAHKRLKKTVPTADVVVTNPTEFAVALKYDSATMAAPRVVAKGQGLMAARIRELAVEAGIPILERKPLARALYKMVEVGQEIPEEFYSTVAEILAYVYELTGKVRRRVAV
jgi:flagellar biosynthetic protein FlhB